MDLFEDLKIKDQLLEDHKWKYDHYLNAIYYLVGDEHAVVVKFKGYLNDKNELDDIKISSASRPSSRPSVILPKSIIISMNGVFSIIPGTQNIVDQSPIFERNIKQFSKDYFLVRELRKIRKPFYIKFRVDIKNEEIKNVEKYKKSKYERDLNRVPISMKREININKILK